jgi:hypothetical protein
MPINWWLFFVAGIIPLAVGFVWYGNMGFGRKWMSLNGFTEESLKDGNMGLLFGLSYVFSVFIAFIMSSMVIHQGGVFGTMMPDVMESGSAAQQQFNDLMAQYGNNFRDFKHGALHGAMITVFFAFPLIAINALFERRGWPYILIHSGYWLVCLILIGGLLCSMLEYGPLS